MLVGLLLFVMAIGKPFAAAEDDECQPDKGEADSMSRGEWLIVDEYANQEGDRWGTILEKAYDV